MQRLEVYQSLWGMELRNPRTAERSTEEAFAMVAEAGFDGMCIDLGADEIEQFRGCRQYYGQHGLGCMVNAFPGKITEMRPLLELAAEFSACMVNVIGGVMPLTVAGAVPLIYRWMEEAERQAMPLLFETHRDGLLNDLFYTLQVMDSVPEMRLCADLSHFVVDREFRSPLPEPDRARIRRVLARSDCFQGRVASREQIQVQLDFPQHQEWVEIFRAWWRDGMQMWRARNDGDATLRFLCELGPPPYAITDGEQQELSDRWQESLRIRDWVRQIWDELDAEEVRNPAPG